LVQFQLPSVLVEEVRLCCEADEPNWKLKSGNEMARSGRGAQVWKKIKVTNEVGKKKEINK